MNPFRLLRALTLTLILGLTLTACGTYQKVAPGEVVDVGDDVEVRVVGDWSAINLNFVDSGSINSMWTVDGLKINRLYFFAAKEGEPLLTNQRKTGLNERLPDYRADMTEPEIMELLEGTLSIVEEAPLVKARDLRPETYLGQPGFAFEFDMVTQNQLEVRGLVIGTRVGDGLQLLMYSAPKLYYFDKDAATVRAIAASARLDS